MQLEVFKYQEEGNLDNLTTIEIDGEVWFVASEVCKLLDIKNTSDAIAKLEDDEKSTIVITDGTSGNTNKSIISESGLYALVFKSSKASAKRFRKWVTKDVIPSIRKRGHYGKIDRSQVPNFYIRYKENLNRIDRNYFSVISELFVTLNAELEKVGYQIPDKGVKGQGMYPDISVGRMFSDYLKRMDSEFKDNYKMYFHSFPDDRSDVEARMYPLEALPTFRRFIYEKWIPNNAQKYFKDRDPLALDYLPKLLGDNT
jgi:prophage antirepressor-like protein